MYVPPVLQKFITPILPSAILHRTALMQVLGNVLSSSTPDNELPTTSSCKLVLLCAPAGYGKTTLLLDTVNYCALPCCWYFLDHTDRDRTHFLDVLLASIRCCFPQFGVHLDAIVAQAISAEANGEATGYSTVIDAFLNAIATEIPQRFVLALCDYHEVNASNAINDMVNHLISHLPPQCVLVIESRALPNLELAPLIAHNKMFGLGSNGLRFTKQELLDLAHVQKIASLSDEEAEQLTNTFDGWIAGMLLGSRLGHVQLLNPIFGLEKNWGASASHASRQRLLAYVVNQVFRDESEVYTFLKEVSIFEQMTPDLCNALLEITDAEVRLAYAEKQGLFIMRTEEKTHSVYTCHPVLRELLLADLSGCTPERFRQLHLRAALLLQESHYYEQALRHAIQANEFDLASQILLTLAPPLVAEGHGETAIHWLSMLPEEMMQKYPQLLLMHANIFLMRGENAPAQPFLEKVEAVLARPPEKGECLQKPLVQAELFILQSALYLYQGEHKRARELAQRALTLLSADERGLRIRGMQRLGICLIVGEGQVNEGIAQLQQALQLCGPRTEERQTAVLHNQLANAYGWIGNYAISEHHRARAILIWEHLGKPWGIINNLTGMGQLKARQGFYKEAEEVYQKALALACGPAKFQSGEAYALLGLGELYLEQARFELALSSLEDSLTLAARLEDRYLLNCGRCALAMTYLLMEDAHTAQCLLDQISLKKEELRSYEGILYCLTKGTIFLALGSYDDAHTTLEQALTTAQNTKIQRLHLQALLRLAVCLFLQQQKTHATNVVQVVLELNKKGDNDHCMQVELQRYPCLQQMILQAQAASSELEDVPPTIQPQVTTPVVEHVDEQEPGTRLQVFALGEPLVLLDGTPITRWRMARAMELYFFLLESGRPMRKEQIIVALWPDASDQIDQTVRSTLYYLRKAIGETCVIQRAGSYSLNLSALYGTHIWYDVQEFEAWYRQAKVALEAEDEEVAERAFQEMIALYRGDYVQSFYSDWCTFRRDELRQAYMEALRQLAFIFWRQERWDESLAQWQQLLAIDACSETAHSGVIRCYMRQGKRELALRQYQRCRQTLQEELMVSPGPALQKLHQRLLSTN